MANLPQHLLAFSIGPVQGFVKEARKAQDVWSGSLILSHMTRAVLEAVARSPGGTVVSPAPPQGRDALSLVQPRVTNEAIVVLAGGPDEAHALVRKAQELWLGLAGRTCRALLDSGLFEEQELALWAEQIEGQFHTAWALLPWPGSSDPARLAEAVGELRRMLGAAKRARPIAPYCGDSRPKCSLCGQWEQMGPVAHPDDDDPERADASRLARRFWGQEIPARLEGVVRQKAPRVRGDLLVRLGEQGRERLCAPCLTKRLGPALALGDMLISDPQERKTWRVLLGLDRGEGGLRVAAFPSAASIAWIDQKERLLEAAVTAATADRGSVREAIEAFNAAVVSFCAAHPEEPEGWHHLDCHATILRGIATVAPELCRPAETFLQLDGDWLSPLSEAREEIGSNKADRRRGVERARARLARIFEAGESGAVRPGRTPPLALLRADADQLGKLQGKAIAAGELEEGTRLSRVLSEDVLERVSRVIQEGCRGRVLFSGGDDVLAMLPAAYALEAAHGVDRAFREAGEREGFPMLRCSVAVAVVSAHRPLRAAIEELGRLLKDAKSLRRPDPAKGAEASGRDDPTVESGRFAFGLAVIPGSGNIKRGLVGLQVPGFGADGTRLAVRETLSDVLIPLAGALTLPSGCGISISPKLYTEWVGEFEPGPSASSGSPPLDGKLLPGHVGGDQGIALAEFRRLALRHIDVASNVATMLPRHVRAQAWADHLLGPAAAGDAAQRDDLKGALADALTARVASLLLSGSVRDGRPSDSPPWDSVAGLLLAIRSLATRELR